MKLGKREIVFFKMAVKNGRVVSKRCAPFALAHFLPQLDLHSVSLYCKGDSYFGNRRGCHTRTFHGSTLIDEGARTGKSPGKPHAHANSGTTAVKTGLAGIRGARNLRRALHCQPVAGWLTGSTRWLWNRKNMQMSSRATWMTCPIKETERSTKVRWNTSERWLSSGSVLLLNLD